MRQLLIVIAASALLLTSCKDKAEPDYQRGQQLEQAGDLEGAVRAYAVALTQDPTSNAGKAAGERMTKVRACIEERQAAEEAFEDLRFQKTMQCANEVPSPVPPVDVEAIRSWQKRAKACNDRIEAELNDVPARPTPGCEGFPPEPEDLKAARKAREKKEREEEGRAASARLDAESSAASKRREAEQRVLEEAKRVVRAEWYSTERDGECAGKGYPPYRMDFTGGTFAQNEVVAFSRGCVHLFQRHSTTSPNDNTFCCPSR